MVHYSKVIQGLAAYVDAELVSKMAGSWRAWLLGGMAGIVSARAAQMFNQYKDNAVIKALGLVQGENIDVDIILAEMRKQAQKGTATLSLPGIAAITFGPADIDTLTRYIKS